MHIADVKVPNEWVTLSSLIGEVEDEATYTLINTSPDIVYAVEGDAIPDSTITGAPIQPSSYGIYSKGSQAELYLRNGYTPVAVSGVGSYIKESNVSVNKVG